jgi:hypothetical protein
MTIAQQLNVKEFPFEIKDKRGNVIYYECSDGVWLKREYDVNGEQTRYEMSNGTWWVREYDAKGNQTKLEWSDGYWEKREYDTNGNIIKSEYSNGYWEKSEYAYGIRIYYETRDGLKIDNRPKVDIEVSLEDIASKFGVDVNQLKIKK